MNPDDLQKEVIDSQMSLGYDFAVAVQNLYQQPEFQQLHPGVAAVHLCRIVGLLASVDTGCLPSVFTAFAQGLGEAS